MGNRRSGLSVVGVLAAAMLGVPPAMAATADDDSDGVTVDVGTSVFGVGASITESERAAGNTVASGGGRAPSQAQVMAARQAYIDSSICLPTAIAGLALGNICAGRIACNETNLGGYLQNPYLATGAGRPTNCTPTPGQDPTAVVNAAVYQAFREVPLPETVLHIQPPDATTLVNLETNFFTTTEPFTTTVTVLGHTVDLDITPTTYTWDFGDGTTTTTTTPGAPYPDLDITHTYTRTGTYPTRLTTTWSADFRVNNGPWQRVDGTVDMPSPTTDLQVREATPVLTD